jgi:hypothetical protein
MGVSYKYSRRKIRLDRGDTLGGTVPLSLRNYVQPDVSFGERRFSRRRRRRGGSSLLSWIMTILLALAIAAIVGLVFGVMGQSGPDAIVPDAVTETSQGLSGWFKSMIERVSDLFAN